MQISLLRASRGSLVPFFPRTPLPFAPPCVTVGSRLARGRARASIFLVKLATSPRRATGPLPASPRQITVINDPDYRYNRNAQTAERADNDDAKKGDNPGAKRRPGAEKCAVGMLPSSGRARERHARARACTACMSKSRDRVISHRLWRGQL